MFEVELKGKTSAGAITNVLTDAEGNLLGEISGDIAADAVDSGNPLKVGSVARTTNPTAVTDADRVSASFDDVGRQLTTPYQVRDLVATALAETATLAEVTLLAGGGAGVFHDLIELTCANQSGVAVTLSIRSETGAGIVKTLVLPATATQTFQFNIPVPQNTAAAAWTIQNAGSGDISTTVVSASAVFIKNV